MAEAMQSLTSKGLRVTPQRIAIFEALLPRKDHPTVEVLYQAIHTQYPTMSLNTVYTTLISLERAGLVRRIDTGDGRCRYDGNPLPHAHIRCNTCSRVDDLPLSSEPDLMSLMREAATSGYTIDDCAIYLYGRCPNCRESQPSVNAADPSTRG